MRPLELLLLAGAMWFALNSVGKPDDMTQLSGTYEEPETASRWDVLANMATVFGVTIGYLLIVAIMLSVLEPQGLAWTLATAAAGMAAGTAALLLVKRAAQHGFTTVLGRNDNGSSG
jgi:hypothetical protein